MFRKIAQKCSEFIGRSSAFVIAVLVIGVWAIAGPIFDYSDTWQLIINTGTTIVTFLMIFLVQNTQNRDARAIHLKLDELIRSKKGARNDLVDIEEESDQRIQDLSNEFHVLREETRKLEAFHEEEVSKSKSHKVKK